MAKSDKVEACGHIWVKVRKVHVWLSEIICLCIHKDAWWLHLKSLKRKFLQTRPLNSI